MVGGGVRSSPIRYVGMRWMMWSEAGFLRDFLVFVGGSVVDMEKMQ